MAARPSGVATMGPARERSFRTESRSVTRPAISTPAPLISPSPMAAWRSPRAKRAPGTATGKYTVAPGAMRVVSMLPPWLPGVPQFTGSPPGATPMTPIMGRTGRFSRSSKITRPRRTGTRREWRASNFDASTPKSCPATSTPWSSMVMASMVAARTSPGSAPSTKMGPVAGFIRSQSRDARVSSGRRIWFSKQSQVSISRRLPSGTRSRGGWCRENEYTKPLESTEYVTALMGPPPQVLPPRGGASEAT